MTTSEFYKTLGRMASPRAGFRPGFLFFDGGDEGELLLEAENTRLNATIRISVKNTETSGATNVRKKAKVLEPYIVKQKLCI